jgi:hypothetical protein
VTTILKAVEELERRRAATAPHPEARAIEEPRRRWSWLAALVTLTSAVAALVFFVSGLYLRQQTAETAAPSEQTAVNPQQPAHRPVAQEAPATDELPRPSLANQGAAAPREDVPPATAPLVAAVPVQKIAPHPNPQAPQIEALAPTDGAHETSPRRAESRRAAIHRSETQRVEVRASAPRGSAPGIQVKSISYSPAPAQRMVTLRIGGAGLVTLHEGDSVSGVEVQLILSDAVYLRRGGSVFAVGATP